MAMIRRTLWQLGGHESFTKRSNRRRR
jgi:hypothetical protein